MARVSRPFTTLCALLAAGTFGGTLLALQPGRMVPSTSVKARSAAPAPTPVFYPNCRTAHAFGVHSIRRGEPGYRDPLDADGDGLACEPVPGGERAGADDVSRRLTRHRLRF